MKHAYHATCDCTRCAKERERRNAQGSRDARSTPVGYHFDREKHCLVRDRAPRRKPVRKPEWGGAKWAETRGDALGESPDY